MQRVYLFISISVLFQFVSALEYFPVDQYALSDGLPNSSITALYVDREGLLWVGTEDGLSSFDGYSFHNYQSSVYDTNSLPNDYIIDILEDRNGNLWCLTPKGISRFISNLEGFSTVYSANAHNGERRPSELKGLAQDNTKGVFYLLGENSVSSYNPETNTWENLPKLTETLAELSVQIHSIAFHTNDNTLLLASQGVIYEWSTYTDTLTKRVLGNKNDAEPINLVSAGGRYYTAYSTQRIWKVNPLTDESEQIYSIQENPKKSQIVSLSILNDTIVRVIDQMRIFEYNILRNNIQSEIAYNTNGDGITSNVFIECGIFWLGSQEGLYKFTLHQHAYSNYKLGDFGIRDAYLNALEFDSQERLWMGLTSGDLLLLEDKGIGNPKISFRFKIGSEINQISRAFGMEILIATVEGLYAAREVKPSQYMKLADGNISAILSYSPDTLVFSSDKGVFWLVDSKKNIVEISTLFTVSDQEIIQMIRKGDMIYLLQTDRLVEYDTKADKYQVLNVADPSLNFLPRNTAIVISGSGNTYIGTSDGIFEHSSGRRTTKALSWSSSLSNQYIHAFFVDTNGTSWFTTNNGLYSVNKAEARIRKYGPSDGLLENDYSDRLVAQSASGKVCFGGNNEFVIFKQALLPSINCTPEIKITQARLSGKRGTYTLNTTEMDTLHIDSRYRHLKFTFTSLDYWNPEENRLQYSLVREGKTADWKSLDRQNYLLVSNLSAEMYTLLVDGTNHEGLLTNSPSKLILIIEAPFWQSRWAIVSYAVFLILFFYLSIFIRTKHLRKLNREYRERELIAKKVEIQKEELSIQNKNITDSINYAKRIQMALMPSRRLFARLFTDSFIMHIPKDIVSGDFYWINEVDDRIYFAAVDCTGHGVPGAFMSIIGFDLFRRITEIEKKKQPAEVLNSLSLGFETIFRDVENITLRDGMDVAFCAIDKKMKVLEFAGAFNPLYLVRDNTITEIKGDRFSVGLNHEENVLENKFSNHVLPLLEGDILYIFTDGFADQFGGPEGKKYKYRRFRHLLLALHQLPMNRQVEFLERSIMDWKGDLDQVDDMLVMGIRISAPNKK